MKTTIYIVRHGESESNVAGGLPTSHWGKSGGSPLTANGIKQAEALAEKLAHISCDSIYSSGLDRAKDTAEIIAKPHKLSVKVNPLAHERVYGELYSAMTSDERKAIRTIVDNLETEKEKLEYRFSPEGESAYEAVNRLTGFIKELSQKHIGKNVLVAAHGNIMRMFLVVHGWANYHELPHGTIENTGYYVIDSDGEHFEITETYGVNKKIAVE